MKVVNTIFTVAALAVPAVVAQFPPDFPPCGVTCVTNMLNQAAALGCPSPDAKCLCTNQNFMYGIRDCSYQYCQNDTAASSIVAYGIEYCKQAGVTVPTDTGPGATGGGAGGGSGGGSGGSASATATGAGGGAGGGPGGAGSSVPVTTSAIVSTISSGGSVITSTVGSTTLFSVVGGGAGGNGGGNGGSVPVSTSSFTTVITTDGSTITSTGASTIYSSASVSVTTSAVVSTIVSDGSTRVTTAGSTVVSSTARPTSTTSSGLAPQMTAAPAGLLAAAGLAALLL